MFHRFILSPEGDRAIKDQGLTEAVHKTANEYENLDGYLPPDEALSLLVDIKETHFAGVPADLQKVFRHTLNQLLRGKGSDHPWVITRPGNRETTEDPIENDILLISGYIASRILKPEDFWNGKERGFLSATDLHGSLGTAVLAQQENKQYREGYRWQSEHEGQIFETHISGSLHGDLRIERTNLTPLPTKDPFGQPVSYRPVGREDETGIAAYHSYETELFAAALKYIDEQKLDLPVLHDGARTLLSELSQGGLRAGNFADFGGNGSTPRITMINFAWPMQKVGDPIRIAWALGREYSETPYVAHIDHQKHFALGLPKKDHTLSETPSLSIPPAEMEQFVRGLFVQAARGLGRTSVGQLEQLLAYRQSAQFETDMADIRRPG